MTTNFEELKNEQMQILEDLQRQKSILKARLQSQITNNHGNLTKVEVQPIKKPFIYRLKLKVHYFLYQIGLVKI